ncbi:MAG: FAD-linked oxidase C-terminal domain-containing protein [Pseudomonadota bacterium]|nr:FAD-linked oxidase C-terminal domain-containing protein [Pseudomonadota bacterium]MEC8549979.1 FAD-linked oxidase C-terminal domain-containing protein [Pseudomonadota bacterium]
MPHDMTLATLQTLLGDRLSTGDAVRAAHSRDEAYSAPALPDAVAFPTDVDEVAAIMKACSAAGCPVVPFGIGTSLEGHVVPLHGGVSVDLSRMDRILEVDERNLLAVVEPGVTRNQLNEALRATGLMFTVDPGANATIGGMASTRASGTNAVRYGTMRENVLALQVVLPDGQVIETGTRARKSSAGYDLTHLFVGSEGTLGIITRLTVRLFGQPESTLAATCAFADVDGAVEAVMEAMQAGLPMARIEFLDEVQMRGMNIYNPDMKLPETPHLFLEFHGSETGTAEQVEIFSAIAAEHGGGDLAWATRAEDRNRLWKARHDAYYAAKALVPGSEGYVTDCCVPISRLAEAIRRARDEIDRSGLVAPILGHVGDGNFHLIILIRPDEPTDLERAHALAETLNLMSIELGGTMTGEHGIGFGKKKYMQAEHGDAYALMGVIKRAVDPGNIMNPGKMVNIN